jgi:hypothetical protein
MAMSDLSDAQGNLSVLTPERPDITYWSHGFSELVRPA